MQEKTIITVTVNVQQGDKNAYCTFDAASPANAKVSLALFLDGVAKALNLEENR